MKRCVAVCCELWLYGIGVKCRSAAKGGGCAGARPSLCIHVGAFGVVAAKCLASHAVLGDSA